MNYERERKAKETEKRNTSRKTIQNRKNELCASTRRRERWQHSAGMRYQLARAASKSVRPARPARVCLELKPPFGDASQSGPCPNGKVQDFWAHNSTRPVRSVLLTEDLLRMVTYSRPSIDSSTLPQRSFRWGWNLIFFLFFWKRNAPAGGDWGYDSPSAPRRHWPEMSLLEKKLEKWMD